MAEKPPVALNAQDITPRVGSNYPPELAVAVAKRAKRVMGDKFGLTQFGVNHVTLEPGAWSSHRHWHEVEDEFVYVLTGTITLKTDEGDTFLTPGMCAGFKAGTGNAHHLVNETTEDVLYLEVGDRMPGDQGQYPDDDLRALQVDGRWTFTHKNGQPYA